LYHKSQKIRDQLFSPLCAVLTKMGIKPDHLSYLNLLMIVPFAYFFQTIPFVSFGVLVVSILIDAVDGCLARFQKISSEKGALLDIASDHFVFFGVLLTLICFRTLDGFWGSLYSLNYLLMIVLVIVMRSINLHVFPILRSKYYFYALWTLLIFTGLNYFSVFLVFFCIYMFLTNLFLFHKLRCSLS